MSLDTEIIDNDDFDILLAEKRHKELYQSLKNIVYSIESAGNGTIIALERQARSINDFAIALGKLNNQPNIEINQKEVIVALKETSNSILAGLSDLKLLLSNKDKEEWVFDVSRNTSGLIESIKAKEI